jgi:hypothetical protein
MVTDWHQANEVARVTPPGGKVLEIGPGPGHATWLLRQWGLDVTTLDYDESLRPDLLADVTKIPCEAGSFDSVLAAEVLEHLPFEESGTTLCELRRVSRGHVIVTLPAPFAGLSALISFPGIGLKGLYLGLPYFARHRFGGQHYWELGKRGYGKRRVRRIIREAGLKIVKEFRPAPSRCAGLHLFYDAFRRVERELRGMRILNYRQRALISHAMRHPSFQYSIAGHQASHNVVYQTARTDLLDLVDRGLLSSEKIGRTWYFTPVVNLEEKLRAMK